jgi:hypothetical protein
MDKRFDDVWTKCARLFLGLFVWLWVLAVLDIIDFHVCIKDAGHCKIIDPTVERAK